MNILHICNDFAGSKVHSNLTMEIDKSDIRQIVYCPVRDKNLLGRNEHDGENIAFEYSYVIRPWHKYLYHVKVHQLYKDLKSKVDLTKVDVIHASTAFSDGALAYKAHKEFGIPYVVAVRITDLSVFIERKLYHTWSMGRDILLNARKIYFISVSCKKNFINTKFMTPILELSNDKIELRPNGIERIWIDNVSREISKSRKLCFIGTFLPRKHLVNVIEAVCNLRKMQGYEDVTLRVIGGGKDTDGKSTKAIEDNPESVEFKGLITDKARMIELMRECCMFVMPSTHETFGLVYIEALSQNLPIVYTKNDGVDGLFDESVGISVNPESTQEIMLAIKQILDHHDRYSNQHVDFSQFDWQNIAREYIEDYKEVMRKG